MDDLHTASQPPEDEVQLPPTIREAFAQLREAFPGQDIPALRWNDSYVAAPLAVDVELPGRGPVRGVDIRECEPIIVLFWRRGYPYFAPLVYSNRKDFPKTKFPHLNVTARGAPAWFCLHRGSIDTWFAEHTIVELVERARRWLRDAARNRLVPEGDRFEPTRAVDKLGTFYYEPAENIGRVTSDWAAHGSGGHVIIAFDLLDDESKGALGGSGYSVRQASALLGSSHDENKALAQAINTLAKKSEYKGLFQRRLFGLLVWASQDRLSRDYFGELPQSLSELEAWAEKLGLPLTNALADYLSNDMQFFGGVPIILAVRRPNPIIGTNSEIELLNFLALASDEHWPKDGVWNPATKVDLADHRTPLTPTFAQELSALNEADTAEPTIAFGAGALGSKMTSHLVRGGSVKLKIVDHAKLSPHNLVRHALGAAAIGRSKAEALKEELSKLYPGVDDLPLEAKFASVLTCLGEANFFDGYRNVIDATASNTVLNILRDASLPDTIRLHRAEIGHDGRLGMLSSEGMDRNPRIDDIQALLFDAAMEIPGISRWLTDVKKGRDEQIDAGGLEDIQIGLSCSSTTMRLADEVVSFHAAALTKRLRRYLSKDGPARKEGALYVSYMGDEGDVQARTYKFAPTVVLDGGSGWQVRVAATVAGEMVARMRTADPRETGGILVGRVNTVRKIIYVTRLVPAPPDSRGTPYGFTRGTERLPESLENVRAKTGGLLSYVGEWHTHPMGGSDLSDIDKRAVINLRSILDPAGRPTLVTIVTPDEIKAHLFDRTSPPVTVAPPRWSFFRVIRVRFGWADASED